MCQFYDAGRLRPARVHSAPSLVKSARVKSSQIRPSGKSESDQLRAQTFNNWARNSPNYSRLSPIPRRSLANAIHSVTGRFLMAWFSAWGRGPTPNPKNWPSSPQRQRVARSLCHIMGAKAKNSASNSWLNFGPTAFELLVPVPMTSGVARIDSESESTMTQSWPVQELN